MRRGRQLIDQFGRMQVNEGAQFVGLANLFGELHLLDNRWMQPRTGLVALFAFDGGWLEWHWARGRNSKKNSVRVLLGKRCICTQMGEGRSGRGRREGRGKRASTGTKTDRGRGEGRERQQCGQIYGPFLHRPILLPQPILCSFWQIEQQARHDF